MLTVTEPGSITVVTCRNGHNPRSHSGAIRLPFLLSFSESREAIKEDVRKMQETQRWEVVREVLGPTI